MNRISHDQDGAERPEDAKHFEVLGADGVVRRYARQDFDQISASVDADEVQRQVALGWVILDERQASPVVTRYVIGYLNDDAMRPVT